MNLAETFRSQGLFSITILRRGPNFGNKWLVKVHKSEKNWLISDEEAKRKAN